MSTIYSVVTEVRVTSDGDLYKAAAAELEAMGFTGPALIDRIGTADAPDIEACLLVAVDAFHQPECITVISCTVE